MSNNKEKINRVFCIGLPKTASTSLNAAFKSLGFKSVHYSCTRGKLREIIRDNSERNRMLLSGIEDYDAYSDFYHARNNIPFLKKLDEQYPNSKFILNTRDLSSWLSSRKLHRLRQGRNTG